MSDPLAAKENPEIEARLRLALTRGNRQLEEREIALLRDRIARNVVLARRLRAVPLGNSDESAHDFSPTGGPVGAEVVTP